MPAAARQVPDGAPATLRAHAARTETLRTNTLTALRGALRGAWELAAASDLPVVLAALAHLNAYIPRRLDPVVADLRDAGAQEATSTFLDDSGPAPGPDAPDPLLAGVVHRLLTSEGPQSFYYQWLELLTATEPDHATIDDATTDAAIIRAYLHPAHPGPESADRAYVAADPRTVPALRAAAGAYRQHLHEFIQGEEPWVYAIVGVHSSGWTHMARAVFNTVPLDEHGHHHALFAPLLVAHALPVHAHSAPVPADHDPTATLTAIATFAAEHAPTFHTDPRTALHAANLPTPALDTNADLDP